MLAATYVSLRPCCRSQTAKLPELARFFSSRPGLDPQILGGQVADRFQEDPEGTANAIASSIDQQGKRALLAALFPASVPVVRNLTDDYVKRILEQADAQDGDGLLNRTELRAALEADRALSHLASVPQGPPSFRTLAVLACAASLPYVAFGFMDNCIMLLAGEEIEKLFGARFGLTTMAAAALGNMVSDVCGVGLAGHIEAQVRKLSWAKSVPPLAQAQRRMTRTRVAKLGGAAVGVSIGCLLGMLPLLVLEK